MGQRHFSFLAQDRCFIARRAADGRFFTVFGRRISDCRPSFESFYADNARSFNLLVTRLSLGIKKKIVKECPGTAERFFDRGIFA